MDLTRKLMMMYKALNPRGYIDRVYVSRKEEERGLEEYIKKTTEKLITAARNSIGIIRINRKTTKTKKQKLEEKQLYGYFKRQSNEIGQKKTRTWFRKVNLKKETVSLLIVAQKNAIRANVVKEKNRLYKQNSKCRFNGEKDEKMNRMP